MKYVDENGVTQFKGYCIDLINAIRNLTLFEMQIYEVEDGKFGNMDENGNWNGMIKDLMDKVIMFVCCILKYCDNEVFYIFLITVERT